MTDSEKQTFLALEHAKSYIDAIDFSKIIDKVVQTKGWKKKDVVKICDLYKHYLFLKKKYALDDLKLPPSEEIDEIWHNHILDTKKYINDCDQIFGFYLHHYPYLGDQGFTDENELKHSFEKTQELHKKEFGDYIHPIRHKNWKFFIHFLKNLFKY